MNDTQRLERLDRAIEALFDMSRCTPAEPDRHLDRSAYLARNGARIAAYQKAYQKRYRQDPEHQERHRQANREYTRRKRGYYERHSEEAA